MGKKMNKTVEVKKFQFRELFRKKILRCPLKVLMNMLFRRSALGMFQSTKTIFVILIFHFQLQCIKWFSLCFVFLGSQSCYRTNNQPSLVIFQCNLPHSDI